jgi:hypothetical protein
MQEFARELISLTVALSRIYAAERPSASSNRWYSPISSVLSCLRPRAKKSEEESRTRRPRGLHRRICAFVVNARSARTNADTACARIYSGDINERKITHRIFVSEGPASRPRHRTDPVAHGPVTLASVSAVALDVRRPFAGSRYQVCGQDRHGYCYSRCAGVL